MAAASEVATHYFHFLKNSSLLTRPRLNSVGGGGAVVANQHRLVSSPRFLRPVGREWIAALPKRRAHPLGQIAEVGMKPHQAGDFGICRCRELVPMKSGGGHKLLPVVATVW